MRYDAVIFDPVRSASLRVAKTSSSTVVSRETRRGLAPVFPNEPAADAHDLLMVSTRCTRIRTVRAWPVVARVMAGSVSMVERQQPVSNQRKTPLVMRGVFVSMVW